jgi:hypothetical protein
MISRIGNVEVVRTIDGDLRGRCKAGGTSGAVGTTGHARSPGDGTKRVRLVDYLPVESKRKDRLADKKKEARAEFCRHLVIGGEQAIFCPNNGLQQSLDLFDG